MIRRVFVRQIREWKRYTGVAGEPPSTGIERADADKTQVKPGISLMAGPLIVLASFVLYGR
jgi:hypothetical protein